MTGKYGNNETVRALSDAFLTALKEKPLTRVTVRELTDAAHIRRQSFYYYFEDVYHLMLYMLTARRDEIMRCHRAMKDWREALDDLFKRVEAEQFFYMRVIEAGLQKELDRLLCDDLAIVFGDIISEHERRAGGGEEERRYGEFVLRCLSLSLTSFYGSWIRGEVREDRDYIIYAIRRIISDQLRGIEQSTDA